MLQLFPKAFDTSLDKKIYIYLKLFYFNDKDSYLLRLLRYIVNVMLKNLILVTMTFIFIK